MASQLNNVIFELYDTEYAEGLLTTKLTETPLISGCLGHYMYRGISKEGDVSGVHERDRPSGHSLTTEARFDLEGKAETGVFLRITHERIPETGGWQALETPKQFKVDFANSLMANNREKLLSLSRIGRT